MPTESERGVVFADPYMQEGFTVVPNEAIRLMREARLSLAARCLYFSLCRSAWQGNYDFPGYKELSQDLLISEQQVYIAGLELESIGLVRQEKTYAA